MKQTAIVLGAGGFIGGHLVGRLKREGYWVRGVDVKFNEHEETQADDFVMVTCVIKYSGWIIDRRFDEVYQLAADMGGAGYIFTGENDAGIMQNSASINLNILDACYKRNISVFFIHLQRVCIHHIQEDLIIQIAQKILLIRILTVVWGKNFFSKDYF